MHKRPKSAYFKLVIWRSWRGSTIQQRRAPLVNLRPQNGVVEHVAVVCHQANRLRVVLQKLIENDHGILGERAQVLQVAVRKP